MKNILRYNLDLPTTDLSRAEFDSSNISYLAGSFRDICGCPKCYSVEGEPCGDISEQRCARGLLCDLSYGAEKGTCAGKAAAYIIYLFWKSIIALFMHVWEGED